MELLVTLRGNFKFPPIIKVDIEHDKIISTTDLDIETNNVSPIKRGSNGIIIKGDLVYVALWDRVAILDKKDLSLIDYIHSPHFSDLHGLDIDIDGNIFVVNTNMQRVEVIKDSNLDGSFFVDYNIDTTLFNTENNYNHLLKSESPFHSCHINDVIVNDEIIIISYLDDVTQKKFFNRIKTKFGFRRKNYKNGGLLFINKKTKKIIKNIRNEGLHDLVRYRNYIATTEYFGNRIVFIDFNKQIINHKIILESEDNYLEHLLSRGIYAVEDGFWVGHTVKRGWEKSNPNALMRFYYNNGEYSGREIKIPNAVGIYSLCLNK